MHVSLHMLADKTIGHRIEVVACEQLRGIVEVRRLEEPAADNILYVATFDELSSRASLPRHLVIVTEGLIPERIPTVPNLGIVESDDVASVYAEIARTLVALSHWDSRMLEAIAARQGIDAVLRIAAEQLDNPIALFDSRQALLGFAGDITAKAGGTIWDDVLLNDYSPIEFFTQEEQREIDGLFRSGRPFRMRPAKNPDREYLCEAITVDRQMVGSVGLVDINAPFTEGQVWFTDLIADRLQMAFALRLGNGPGADDTAYLLRSILNGNKADHGLIAYHLDKLGWSRDAGFRLLLMPLPEGAEQSAGNESRLTRIARALGKAISIIYENSIVALTSASRDIAYGTLQELLGRLGMECFESEPFSSIADARIAYDQCLLLASALGTGYGAAARISDSFECALVAAIANGTDPRVLCSETIRNLAVRGYKGDVERGRTLVRELYVYLARGCNSHHAARELFLHRNTLIYHIEQLERLLGCRFGELSVSQKFFLMVSCIIALEEKL